MIKRIYIMAPASTWDGDRYEQFIHLLYHEYPTATIIEQKDTPECPKGISTVIFIRGEDRCIDINMWTQLNLAHAGSRIIKLARMDRDGLLVFVPWRQLEFDVKDDGHVQVGYAKPAASKQEKVEVVSS